MDLINNSAADSQKVRGVYVATRTGLIERTEMANGVNTFLAAQLMNVHVFPPSNPAVKYPAPAGCSRSPGVPADGDHALEQHLRASTLLRGAIKLLGGGLINLISQR